MIEIDFLLLEIKIFRIYSNNKAAQSIFIEEIAKKIEILNSENAKNSYK